MLPSATFLKTKYLLLFSILTELILFYFYYYPETKLFFGDESRYLKTALSITQGGNWHPNALWPPMQSILIAFFIKFFPQPVLALQIFQYALLLLSGFIVRDIVYRETRHLISAQIALGIMIVYPTWLAYSQYLWPEVIHVTLFVGIIWINRYKSDCYKWLVVSGALLGLALLFKSILILFIPFLYLSLFKKNQIKKSSIKVIVSLVVTIIVIAPASIKAHKMTGGWMVSNSSMFNLWMGLNDDKRQNFAHDIGGITYRNYIKSASDSRQRNEILFNNSVNKIQEEGYVNTVINQLKKQYFRLFDYQSFFTQQFKGDKKDNYVNKYSHNSKSYFVKVFLFYTNIFYYTLMVLMLLGLYVSYKSSVIAKQFAMFLLYTIALFILLHTKPRFRIPLVPIMAYFTAYIPYYLYENKIKLSQMKQNIKTKVVVLTTMTLVFVAVFMANYFDKIFPI